MFITYADLYLSQLCWIETVLFDCKVLKHLLDKTICLVELIWNHCFKEDPLALTRCVSHNPLRSFITKLSTHSTSFIDTTALDSYQEPIPFVHRHYWEVKRVCTKTGSNIEQGPNSWGDHSSGHGNHCTWRPIQASLAINWYCLSLFLSWYNIQGSSTDVELHVETNTSMYFVICNYKASVPCNGHHVLQRITHVDCLDVEEMFSQKAAQRSNQGTQGLIVGSCWFGHKISWKLFPNHYKNLSRTGPDFWDHVLSYGLKWRQTLKLADMQED